MSVCSFQNFCLPISITVFLCLTVLLPLSYANQPETVLDAVVEQLKQNEGGGDNHEKESKSDEENSIDKSLEESTSDSDLADVVVERLEQAVDLTNNEENSEDKSFTNIAAELAEVVEEAVEENIESVEATFTEDTTKNNSAEVLVNSDSEDISIETGEDNNTEVSTKAKADEKPRQAVRKQSKKKKTENKKPRTFSQGEARTVKYILNTRLVKEKSKPENRHSGWVYLGHFTKKGWLGKTLDIKKSLPKVGRSYTVMQSLNMRSEPPTKTGTAQLIKNLKKDDHVRILKIRPSGRAGHYWAQVEFNKL